VDSRLALPALKDWLEHDHGVEFRMGETVLDVDPPVISTSRGEVLAERAVVCPGDDFEGLYAGRIDGFELKRCRLSMMRLAAPGFDWPAGVMSDLGLARYRGYADLPEAEPLKQRLQVEQPRHLADGVHLIAVQNADGSLVVGDSHHYDDLPTPFAPAEAEALILDEFEKATGLRAPPVLERWTGTYAVSADRSFIVDAPSSATRLVIVTSGTGASIAFAVAERTIAELCGVEAPTGAVL
jgi:D-hydroxyproline dehydrogenase subunit beta